MTAARDGKDLGTNGVKWLTSVTASGKNPLQGTPYSMSRMLGGIQFSHSFSSSGMNANGSTDGSTDIEAEGCPTFPATLCSNLTPAQGFFNVMQDSFFGRAGGGTIVRGVNGVTYRELVLQKCSHEFPGGLSTPTSFMPLDLRAARCKQIAGSPASPANPGRSRRM